jgi:hypothetical protein
MVGESRFDPLLQHQGNLELFLDVADENFHSKRFPLRLALFDDYKENEPHFQQALRPTQLAGLIS